jgi:hypothetical protein
MKQSARYAHALCVCALACAGEAAEVAPQHEPPPAAAQVASALPAAASRGAEAATADADFPLRSWMLADMPRAMRVRDFAALARALNEVAQFAPDEFPRWAAIAQAGAQAAAREDIEQVGASCAGCHEKYRPTYRTHMRVRPLIRSARGTIL